MDPTRSQLKKTGAVPTANPQPWMPQLVKYQWPANITTGCCNHWTLSAGDPDLNYEWWSTSTSKKKNCLKSWFEGDSRWDCSKALARNPYLKKTHCTPLRCPISTPLAPLIISLRPMTNGMTMGSSGGVGAASDLTPAIWPLHYPQIHSEQTPSTTFWDPNSD